jgi:hypothetical protein
MRANGNRLVLGRALGMNLGCVGQHDNAVQIGVMRRMKHLAVSDIHILPSVWRNGNDMMSIMSQTAFQAALVRVGAGRPTEKVQQPQTERPVWSGESVNQTASRKILVIQDSTIQNRCIKRRVKRSFWKCS